MMQKANIQTATRGAMFLLFFLFAMTVARGGVVIGTITDAATGEPLIGATVAVTGTTDGTVADAEGRYRLDLAAGVYLFRVRYIGYADRSVGPVAVAASGEARMDITLEADVQSLGEVAVTAVARRATETAQIAAQRQSLVVQSGLSAQQLARAQDRDGAEAIRRVPGISIIDGAFVMVRGLSQRYNNVWLNGGAIPSSEADSRAFAFDLLPGGQIEEIVVVKSPAPEYPADFTGGFVLVNTKQATDEPGASLSVGLGANDETHVRSFTTTHGGAWDWTGFGAMRRRLGGGMASSLRAYEGYGGAQPRLDVEHNGLDNDWTLAHRSPMPDVKASGDYRHRWRLSDGSEWGLLATANYSHTLRTARDMENSLYGPYDTTRDTPVALRRATDDQCTDDVHLGAMTGVTFRPRGGRHTVEWKTLFNLLSRDRYTERRGINAQPDSIHNIEYYYASRMTVHTQLTARHLLSWGDVDWGGGYAYANRDLPDRRLIERTDRTEQTMGIYRIGREFARLDEHIGSFQANVKSELRLGRLRPTLRAGLYGERRTRTYRTRQFQYGWQPDNALPDGFLFADDIARTVLIAGNYGPDKLYLYEEVNYLNNYEGDQTQLAAYAAAYLPIGTRWSVYAGARYEYNLQTLRMNTRQYEPSLRSTDYDSGDLFPSVNIAYRLNERHQFRVAYGRSVNRPEFRELSTSVYYDFELGSNVMGNYDLRPAYIDNVDLRYEWYPTAGEVVSVAFFYKHFRDPIEWTYTVAGGTDLVYSFINARGADNRGVEVDIRKNLDFIGLRDFALSFNGAWIRSRVRFAPGTADVNRPMQGQSPYLINAGLFYNNTESGWNAALLYNRIGKRIIGVGNRYGTAADGTARHIPNSYEMPRDAIDLSASYRRGRWEWKAAVRDLLAERCLFKQFETLATDDGSRTIAETTRSYKPGRSASVTVAYSF